MIANDAEGEGAKMCQAVCKLGLEADCLKEIHRIGLPTVPAVGNVGRGVRHRVVDEDVSYVAVDIGRAGEIAGFAVERDVVPVGGDLITETVAVAITVPTLSGCVQFKSAHH